MTKSITRTAWAGTGLAVALTVGLPAIADDTELLLSTPNTTGADRPNILFILDSSGSMTSIEKTQQPFDSSVDYPGSCSDSDLYITSGKSIPECDSSSRIQKSQFLCDKASLQLASAGSYTDTMAQFRKTNRSGFRWRSVRSDNSGFIECMGDSGIHGDGTDKVYAQIGTNVEPFTKNEDREVAWTSRPTDGVYSVYDPNYLNWFHDSPITTMSRTEIVKAVTKNVLGSINNVNVGFMQFYNSEGGPVTRAVKDLDSSRSQAIATVDALPADGWTPLSETMYEAALYWQGQQAYYGGLSATDKDALKTSNPMVYKNPANYACAKNFTVLLTDGAPTQDTGAYDKVKNLPGFTKTMGRSNCTGGTGDGTCLDDIAEYLSKKDINPAVPGNQHVTTYTIGFKVDLPLLKETAENSGGQYYLAEDVQTLTAALTEIVTSIFDKDISFTAPAVSVNAFNRTQHLNDLYVSVFRATTGVHWPGNLKKYTVSGGVIRDAKDNPAVNPATGYFADSALSFWTPGSQPDGANVHAGGSLSHLPSPSNRNIYSNLGSNELSSSENHISTENLGNLNLLSFGLTGAAGEPTATAMIDWMRGVDVRDIDNDPNTKERRQMGDTLHSQPASVVYSGGAGPSGAMDIVVYSATNNGYLHATDASTGEELWSFVPKELLPGMVDLFYDETVNYKHYGIDGDLVPIVFDRNHDGNIDPGTDQVLLVFGMRRGGDSYYALDVTNKNAPKLLWVKTYDNMGQTWSTPVPARIRTTGAGATGSDHAVLVIGGGYDTTHDQAAHPATPDADGAGIYFVDMLSGTELWRAGADGNADLPLTGMTRAIPSAVRVLDMSGDGFADRMYAADLGGQIWRFDIKNGNLPSTLVSGGVIARFGAEGLGPVGPADTRRFYATPDVSMFSDEEHDRRYLAISIGSGYRAHPLDKTANDRFYSLRDPDVFTQKSQLAYNSYDVAEESDLVDVSGKVGVKLKPADRGWKFTLPPGEKILAESRTFDDTVYFVSFEPEVASADPCQAGLSVNRLYRVSVGNGDPVTDLDTIDPNDPGAADDARVTKLEQGGIAVRPIFLFPSPLDPDCEGEECSPPPIGCVGVECFDPGFPNNPVRTLWTQDGTN